MIQGRTKVTPGWENGLSHGGQGVVRTGTPGDARQDNDCSGMGECGVRPETGDAPDWNKRVSAVGAWSVQGRS